MQQIYNYITYTPIITSNLFSFIYCINFVTMEDNKIEQAKKELEAAKANATDPKIKAAIEKKIQSLGKDICK